MTILLLSALFSGLVAIAVTRAVERFGGVVGGLLGTLPTTIVPASLGIWAASAGPQEFSASMGMVPIGMLLNAGFLWIWRALPPRLPEWSLTLRLNVMVATSLGAWFVAAATTTTAANHLVSEGVSSMGLGAVGLVVGLVVGTLAVMGHTPAPKGRNPVSWTALLVRGGLAACAIAVSVALAQSGVPVLAGTASVFPAIFLTTMAGLWLAQGEAVPAGAVGPMMLGATSVSVYALLAAALFPVLGPTVGTATAWLAAVVGVTIPSAWWLRPRPSA